MAKVSRGQRKVQERHRAKKVRLNGRVVKHGTVGAK